MATATCPYTWQSERDLSLRKDLIEEIRHLFVDNNSPLVSEGGFPEYVKKLELLLYMHARSQEEYMDRSTLLSRLRAFAKQLRGGGGGVGDLYTASSYSSLRPDSCGFSAYADFLPPDSGCRVPGYSFPGGSLRLGDGPNAYYERPLTRDLPPPQLQDDPLKELEDGGAQKAWHVAPGSPARPKYRQDVIDDLDFMSCSPVPKCHSPQGCVGDLGRPSLDAELLDEPVLEDPGFGETWFSFSNEDLLSSEDSICDFDAFSRLPGLAQAPTSPALQQWNSTSSPVMTSSVMEKAMNADFASFKSQPPPTYESVPVHQNMNGSCKELSNSMGLCPSILPVDAISQAQVKAHVMETMHPSLLSQKMVAPQPLVRHLSSVSDLQENNPMGLLWNNLSDKIDPMVHAYKCTRSNCDVMCLQLRKLFDHVRRCRLRKKPTSCPSCQWVGLLLSMHAQKCRVKPCPLPCCK